MAIVSPIFKSTIESRKTLSESKEGIKKLTTLLEKRQKVKREAYAKTNLFRQKRENNDRRQQLEDELEAPKIVVQPGGPAKLIQEDNNRGFFDRILGFIGYLAAGWIMNNLPTWIGMGKEFIARLKRAGEIVSGFFGDTVKLFTGFGNLLSAASENLMRFDFFDTSNRIKNAMQALNFTVGDMGNKIEEAYGLATTPLTEGKYSGEDIPGLGTQQTNEGAYEEPAPYTGAGGGTSSASGNQYERAFLDLIANAEGTTKSYGVVFGGSVNKDLETGKLTVQQVINLGNSSRTGSGAVGRYQFMPNTLLGLIRNGTLKANEPFTPQAQDRAAIALARGRGVNPSKKLTVNDMYRLGGEWASIEGGPNMVPGGSYSYGGRSQVKYSGAQALKIYESKLSTQANQQSSIQAPNQSSLPPLPQTDTLGGGVQRYGALRRGGRRHAGTDFDISGNQKFYSRIGGIVTKIGYDPGGYGNYIDIYNSQLGVYERIAEAARILVKQGQTIQPGQAIVQGEGSTGVIHYEIRKNSGYGFSGTLDPVAFLKSPLAQSQKFQQPAQIAAAPRQSQSVPSAITPERRGQDIIIAQPRNQQQIVSTPSGGGGEQAPSPINEFDLLNNFIKNKLLLDLAYL